MTNTQESASVLVVHCVDAEGPLGGDARRLEDGSPEFYDNWDDIRASLAHLTSLDFRTALRDSEHGLYRYTWFPLDFTGFKTNPKNRDTTPHAVYDLLHSLPTQLDEFGFHHHIPPKTGIGDEWADRWDPVEAEKQLEALLLERGHCPRVFRAGGTIEFDGPMNQWLERFPLDFSNRVSERSDGKGGLRFFDWFGAPDRWGSYQASAEDFKAPGGLGRRIYRCVDARSPYNELTRDHVAAAFAQAKKEKRPAVLSYFSHDNREMAPETEACVSLIRAESERTGIPWRSCTASEADAVCNPSPASSTLPQDGEQFRGHAVDGTIAS